MGEIHILGKTSSLVVSAEQQALPCLLLHAHPKEENQTLFPSGIISNHENYCMIKIFLFFKKTSNNINKTKNKNEE